MLLQSIGSLFLQIVFTAIGAKFFRQPSILPPRCPPHLLTNFITEVDAKSRNAMPLVEPGCFLRDFHFFPCLLKHLLHTWELKSVIQQPSQPYAAQFRRVKVRNTLEITHESHVWDQRMNCAPQNKHSTVLFFTFNISNTR
ncbi:hypothetical protein PRUPE_7G193300 [Prunus persica]|uniref:Secreted protein n=1 Tax=Prunus persica TaxID=3760 RepID=A0A251NDY6_PRUPE|nr:hypothetical protein PRUPE_7G193300 [Prunus persica]